MEHQGLHLFIQENYDGKSDTWQRASQLGPPWAHYKELQKFGLPIYFYGLMNE
jgi:hypothetical protein